MDPQPLKDILPAEALCLEEDKLRDLAVDGLAPRAAAYPRSLEEAARVVRAAHDNGWALLCRGGGSKAAFGRPPSRYDLLLSLKGLNRIIDIDPPNLTVTVQAGVPLADLQDLVGGYENRCFFPLDGELKEKADEFCSDREHKGAFVPLDPPFGTRATMGGILATGSAGPSRLRHGLPRDLVLGTRFIRADGTVIGMGGKTVKNVSGYDVSKLMIGSLGSLGVIAETTLRLLPLPEKRGGLVMVFAKLDQALACCGAILDSKLLPLSLELFNRAGAQAGAKAALEGPAQGWWLAVGLDGPEAAYARQVRDMTALAQEAGAHSIAEQDQAQARRWWERLSEAGAETQAKAVCRAHFPLSAYPVLARTWADLARESGAGLALQPGCGTARAFLSGGSPKEQAALGGALRRAAQEAGGGMIVEAAGPELKGLLDVWGPLPSSFKVMESLKKSLDPKNTLNPGRFLGGL